MSEKNISLEDIEQRLLEDYIRFKIRNKEISLSESIIDKKGIVEDDDNKLSENIPFKILLKLREELFSYIRTIVIKNSQVFQEFICPKLTDDYTSLTLDLIYPIVKQVFFSEPQMPGFDPMDVSLYLIKSEMVSKLCI